MATSLKEIPDHLMSDIFLRLPTPEDLARASAACVSFRRIVTDRSFIRRFRRLHAPPLLGFLGRGAFNPATPPHPSASGARALALAADFSFSFLPSHCRWTVQDTRDGRVLLSGIPEDQEGPIFTGLVFSDALHRRYILLSGTPECQERPIFPELVVSDPLHRRYILLPPVPDDLTSLLENLVPISCKHGRKPYLVPLGEEETADVEGTSFRVIWMAHCQNGLSAFVFSSSTGQWRAASTPWTNLVVGKAESDIMSQIPLSFLRRHYAYGCLYWDWLPIKIKKLLVLDTRRMEFSMSDLPPGEWSTQGLAIVEAGEGRLGIFGFRGGSASDLIYTVARNKGESPSQCQMEKTISLESRYKIPQKRHKYFIEDATERYLLLTRTKGSPLDNLPSEYFSMDIMTFKLQRVRAEQGTCMYGKHIYTNFRPSLLSSPTI